MVGKAEQLPAGPNPRFVVTSLPVEAYDPRSLYEDLYCARGDMENRIKEQQLALFADRTSSATLRANQLRLYWSTLAYVLLHALRRWGWRAPGLPARNVTPYGCGCSRSVRRSGLRPDASASRCPANCRTPTCSPSLQTACNGHGRRPDQQPRRPADSPSLPGPTACPAQVRPASRCRPRTTPTNRQLRHAPTTHTPGTPQNPWTNRRGEKSGLAGSPSPRAAPPGRAVRGRGRLLVCWSSPCVNRLFLGHIVGICSLVTPCQPGA